MQILRLLQTARLEKSDQAGNARPAFFVRFFDTKAAPVLVVRGLTDPTSRLSLSLANLIARI